MTNHVSKQQRRGPKQVPWRREFPQLILSGACHGVSALATFRGFCEIATLALRPRARYQENIEAEYLACV